MNTEYTEILETLDHLEENLVSYSAMLSAESVDPSLVHTMFRTAHNLKSSLAMINHHGASTLIHSVENAFDDIRNGNIQMTHKLIDLSLVAIDEVIKNLEGNDNGTILRQTGEMITSYLEEKLYLKSKKKTPILPFHLKESEKKLLVDKMNAGENILLIEKMMTTSIQEPLFNNLPILREIDENGTFISKNPDFSDINRKNKEFLLQILFTSKKSKEDFFFIIFDPLKELELSLEDIDLQVDKHNDSKAKKDKLNILIVEDNFVARHLAQSIMSGYGTSDVAINGTEALYAFKNAHENQTPYDIILLDIKIPEADGHKVLKEIREYEETNSIAGLDRVKVVVLSGVSDLNNIMRMFREQADAYIIKPLTEEKIKKEFLKFDNI